ncbi:HD domain-containing protein [Brevundimonas sp.]|jgi:phosphonate degradation associated HDIG domain protein|uniref:HD domain-containing protein n=1 Tax=Brevundimonas sp. TaxID=1871086 RepID=UPI003D0F2A33
MTSPVDADAFVAELSDLFARLGGLHYGEDVSQLEHALQTAHHAKVDGAPPALVAAALLHDVGHMMQKAGEDAADRGIDTRHEHISAGYLSRAFGPEVTEPVRLHVAAKRCLAATAPGYVDRLSAASLQSLALQGGPMDAAEIDAFMALPQAKAALRLRAYDEMGKAQGVEVADFATYRELLCDLIARRAMPGFSFQHRGSLNE